MQDNPAKSKPAYAPRVCEDCGVRFTPLSGRGTRCPLCRKLHRREQKQQYNQGYYDAHQDELVAYAAQYRAEHPDEHRAASLRWEQANPERKRDNDAAYRERNRLRIRAEWKAAGYPRNTPAQYASNARRRQRLATGMTSEDRRLSALFRQISVDFPCFYCGAPVPAGGPHELEHYFPLSQGGTDVWKNILRACWECNRGTDGKHDTCGTAFMLWRGDWKPFMPPEPALNQPAA
jgi:hypothetical protein